MFFVINKKVNTSYAKIIYGCIDKQMAKQITLETCMNTSSFSRSSHSHPVLDVTPLLADDGGQPRGLEMVDRPVNHLKGHAADFAHDGILQSFRCPWLVPVDSVLQVSPEEKNPAD